MHAMTFVTVVTCHIVAQYLRMKVIGDIPHHSMVTQDIRIETEDYRKEVLHQITRDIS